MTGTDFSPTLPNGASPLLDEAVWQALLAVAGPQDAVWLVRQVVADLTRFAAEIAATGPARDVAGMRAAGHALAGLAGTIGAAGLRRDAERMNAGLQTGAWADVETLATGLTAGVARLTDELRLRLAALSGSDTIPGVGA